MSCRSRRAHGPLLQYRSPWLMLHPLDCFDLLSCQFAPLALGQLAEPDRAIGHTMQPFDLETQRFSDAAHDPLPPFGQRQLDLDRLPLRPYARVDDAHGPAVDHDPLREGGPDGGSVSAVHAQPVAAGPLVTRMPAPA